MTQGSKIGKAFKIKCGSKYFDTKYGGNPVVIKIEGRIERLDYTPPTFLFQGRS